MGFNARAAIFQHYSDDEHEINYNDDEMKNGLGHKDCRVDKFWLPPQTTVEHHVWKDATFLAR